MSFSFNEGDSAAFRLEWLSRTGQVAAAQTIRYRIDCDTTGQVVRAATSLSPSADLELTPDDTAILEDGTAEQYRRITVVASWGTNDQLVREIFYIVRPLKHYPLEAS